MDRFDPSRAPTDDAKTIAAGGSLFAASRAQFSPNLIVFYADSTFPLIHTSDSTPPIASSSSDNPRRSTSIGPHRVRDQDKQKVRFEPYTVDPVSRPSGVIERQRTPYAIAPAPSSSAAPSLARSPPPASPKIEPLPHSLMHSAFNLAAEGMPRNEFDDMFVVCHRCNRVVFAETFESHHPSVCRGL
ncbi:hypothetical protein EXIGLDRAFT_154098 [Exidia glandulosa HHB12029]|uniref:Uncharacterized protein n=1 Tax=Exidia glandulosa HHB12029 TaxID=1314781 RepID=A0A165QHH8_EXIGL|nr:hypothetical protein EXIGLDRAFT_154098 [Exidia glandulosa HHB12029]